MSIKLLGNDYKLSNVRIESGNSKLSALSRIKQNLDKDPFIITNNLTCEINNNHNCVDIIYNGNVYAQVYANPITKSNSVVTSIQKITDISDITQDDIDNGRILKRIKRPGDTVVWSSKNPFIKIVKDTGNLEDKLYDIFTND